MVKNEHFNFKLSTEERRWLDTLARRQKRTRSDTVRWLIYQAALEEARADARKTIDTYGSRTPAEFVAEAWAEVYTLLQRRLPPSPDGPAEQGDAA